MGRQYFICAVESKGFAVHKRAKDMWGGQHFTVVDDNGGECYSYEEALMLADLYEDERLTKLGWVKPSNERKRELLNAVRALGIKCAG